MIYIFSALFIFALLAAIGTLSYFFSERQKRKKLEEVFGERQELDEKEFYERYFAEKGIPFYIVQQIRQVLEDELGANLSRLSAKDDFSKNLSFFWEHDSLADVEIVMRLEEEFQIELTSEDLPNQFRTIDGIVNLVWQKVREKENPE